MTDEQILQMVMDRELVVDCKNAIVWKQGLKLAVAEHTSRRGGTYRFVNVCKSPNLKRKIALHRLVWMAYHRQVVPDGFDIDHAGSQTDDRIENLQCIPASENRSKGAKSRWRDDENLFV